MLMSIKKVSHLLLFYPTLLPRLGGAMFLTVLALSLLAWVNGHALWELWVVWGKHAST